MATYLILNILFIVGVCLLGKVKPRRPSKAFLVTLLALLLLTVLFDNVIVGLSIVDYDPQKILGIKLLHAPVEDFMYAILAVILVPLLWRRIGDKHAH